MAIPLRFTAPLLIVLLTSAPASAEPIQITGGTLTPLLFTAPDFRAQYSLGLTEGFEVPFSSHGQPRRTKWLSRCASRRHCSSSC